MRDQSAVGEQGRSASELQGLQQHEAEVRLRLSDLRVQIGQLQEQKDMAAPRDKVRFNQPIADLRHQDAVATLDFDATHARIAALKAAQTPVATTIQRIHMPMISRQEIEKAGVGAFLLMVPLVLALARRIWVRSAPRVQPPLDLESSPRLQRLEQAVEAIALEVERIGEGQRFTTTLLSERLADPAVKRITPPESSGARRAPGTVTPH